MNQLGFFDEIKKEDYDIKQNAKDKTVDILVKVKEKGKNSIGISGGISGLAGNFIGLNYATNNFLGLGATLSLGFQWGTFQKMYSFGFTEPYLFDKPITAGFTVFKSDYNYNQIRQLAIYSGINPNLLAQSQYGQYYGQNFTQNSDGFTMFATYPLRRSFARIGLTYSFSRSSLQAFSAASESYFEAINFSGLTGPNALTGIISSQIMPTYLYSTINSTWTPTRGKYLYAAHWLYGKRHRREREHDHAPRSKPSISTRCGTFAPTTPPRSGCGSLSPASSVTAAEWFHPSPASTLVVRWMCGVLISAPSARWRFIPRWFPCATAITMASRLPGPPRPEQVQVRAVLPPASPLILRFSPAAIRRRSITSNTVFPLSDRRPAWLSFLILAAILFCIQTSSSWPRASLSSIESQYTYFPIPSELKPVAVTNYRPRSSVGLDLQVLLPIVNAPIHIFYGYNVSASERCDYAAAESAARVAVSE